MLLHILCLLVFIQFLFPFLAVIGTGKTVLKYFAKDEGMLSFANNKPVKIFSKGSGSNPDLWGVMVRTGVCFVTFCYASVTNLDRWAPGLCK